MITAIFASSSIALRLNGSSAHAAWEPAGEIGIRSGLAAIRVGRNETWHRKIGILHQTAAQRLADHMLPANLTPAFDGDAAQDDPFAMAEMHR